MPSFKTEAGNSILTESRKKNPQLMKMEALKIDIKFFEDFIVFN